MIKLEYYIIVFFLSFLILKGCSSESVNKSQRQFTLKNISCYNTFIDRVKNESDVYNNLEKIRDSQSRGDQDPITIQSEFRLINYHEFSESIKSRMSDYCPDDGLLGIRLITKDLIIIDVNRIDRHTLNEKFSSKGTIEFHRLIYGKNKPELKKYSFGTEHELLYEKLEDGVFYQVTTMKSMYGLRRS